MTIPTLDDQINLMKFVRATNKKTLIIANAYHKKDAKVLYEHGANFVMMPHFLGGHWISKVLSKEKWNLKTMSQLKLEQDKMLLK